MALNILHIDFIDLVQYFLALADLPSLNAPNFLHGVTLQFILGPKLQLGVIEHNFFQYIRSHFLSYKSLTDQELHLGFVEIFISFVIVVGGIAFAFIGFVLG